MNKKNLKLFVTIIFGLATYILLIYFFYKNTSLNDVILMIGQIKTWVLILLIISGLIMILLQGFYLKSVINYFNIKISVIKSIITWLITVPVSSVTVGIGGPLVIYNELKKEQISLQFAAVITSFYLILYFIIYVLFILLVGGLTTYQSIFEFNPKDLLIFTVSSILLLFIILIIIPGSRKKILEKLKKYFPNFFANSEWNDLSKLSIKHILKSILLVILIILINFVIFNVSFMALEIDISLIDIIKFFVLFNILTIFSPTGGGIGFVELGLTGSLAYSGIDASRAILFVIIFRLINFWFPALLGWIFFSIKGYNHIIREVNNNKQ